MMATQLTLYALVISISRTTANCGTFPSVQLQPTTSSSWIYNDPNSMGTCLFDSRVTGNAALSTNFRVSEFTSKDGAAYFRLSPTLIECLQSVRTALNAPLIINSGYRTVRHNANVPDASSTSRHMSGTAADVRKPSSVSMDRFAKEIICRCRPLFQSKGNDIGLGLGVTYIHVDMRPYLGSWIYSGASKSAAAWRTFITTMGCPGAGHLFAAIKPVEIVDKTVDKYYHHAENHVGFGEGILLISTHSVVGAICLIIGLCIGKRCKCKCCKCKCCKCGKCGKSKHVEDISEEKVMTDV